MITKTIKAITRRVGFDVSRYRPDTHHDARYRHLLETRGIDLILDVGANEGQFGSLLRSEFGYRGRILSFEPLEAAHAALTKRAASDPARLWFIAPRMALGSSACSSTIHVAGNSVSSSILPMEPLHEAADPTSVGGGVEAVMIRRLDEALRDMRIDVDRRTLLKIDTQGYELEVLQGAPDTLGRAGAVQAEMSFQPLYGGQPLFDEVCGYLLGRGFTVFDIIPGFSDPQSGRLLQADGVFVRD